MLSGTEAEIINCVARLRKATKDQIRRQVGFSLDYVGFLCQYLVRKGYLTYSGGYYYLSKVGIKTLLKEEEPKVDRELIKEVAGELAKEIGGELRKTVKGIKIPVSVREVEKAEEERVKIKTDFEFPVEDESLTLESNIGKLGAKLEKERFDIEDKVKLLRQIQKRRKK